MKKFLNIRKSNVSFKKQTINNPVYTDLKKLKAGFYLMTLGGAGEFGTNLNVFGYVTNNSQEWIIIDAGVSINRNYGINLVYASIDAIRDLNIIGIVITHAHIDHIGALPFILPQLGITIPMYATPFTALMIKKSFEEHNVTTQHLKIINLNSTIQLGNIRVEFHYITHSIIEPNMIYIECPLGNALHTGDWKLDANPGIGEGKSIESLNVMFKDKKINAIIGDSTNAFKTDHTKSELDVKNTLQAIMKKYNDRRIVISCFSSNIARLSNIIQLAQAAKRPVVLVGTSLKRFFQAALSLQYVNDRGVYYKDNDSLAKLDKSISNRAVMVCTGSQGEKNSILYKIANNIKIRDFLLRPTDVVVLSAGVIPGNEKEVSKIINSLLKFGVHIIDQNTYNECLHVSGHPGQPEILALAKAVNPKVFIPVHGEYGHFMQVKKLMKENTNIPVLIPENGCIINLTERKIVGHVHYSTIGVDGYNNVPMDSKMLQTRSMLGESGSVFISAVIGNQTIHEIRISTCGLVTKEFIDDNNFLAKIRDIIHKSKALLFMKDEDNSSIRNLSKEVSNNIYIKTKKNPIVVIHKIYKENKF